MSLFCLLSSESSSGNIWTFENVTINATSTDASHYVVTGEVLMLRNVTMEMEGLYSCLTASGKNHSAFVTVIGG